MYHDNLEQLKTLLNTLGIELWDSAYQSAKYDHKIEAISIKGSDADGRARCKAILELSEGILPTGIKLTVSSEESDSDYSSLRYYINVDVPNTQNLSAVEVNDAIKKVLLRKVKIEVGKILTQYNDEPLEALEKIGTVYADALNKLGMTANNDLKTAIKEATEEERTARLVEITRLHISLNRIDGLDALLHEQGLSIVGRSPGFAERVARRAAESRTATSTEDQVTARSA